WDSCVAASACRSWPTPVPGARRPTACTGPGPGTSVSATANSSSPSFGREPTARCRTPGRRRRWGVGNEGFRDGAVPPPAARGGVLPLHGGRAGPAVLRAAAALPGDRLAPPDVGAREEAVRADREGQPHAVPPGQHGGRRQRGGDPPESSGAGGGGRRAASRPGVPPRPLRDGAL